MHYFYIVAYHKRGKRGDYARAADECVNWLNTYNSREDLNSPEGIGVLFQLAKNIDAQITKETSAGEHAARRRRRSSTPS